MWEKIENSRSELLQLLRVYGLNLHFSPKKKQKKTIMKFPEKNIWISCLQVLKKGPEPINKGPFYLFKFILKLRASFHEMATKNVRKF